MFTKMLRNAALAGAAAALLGLSGATVRRCRTRTTTSLHILYVLTVVIVVGSVVHGILIEGTMETMTKAALCVLVLAAAVKVMADLRVWRSLARR